MTDDKGAGDGPYYVTDEYCNEVGGRRFVIRGPGLNAQTTASLIREELVGSARIRNRAYAEGRKAEREITARLLMYARHRDSCGDMDAHNHDEFPSCNCGLDELKDAIRGGNDAK